jgi:protein MpaA
VDLWLVPSMNPDGQAHQVRTNAHQVDLNRNFPQGWAPLGQPGDSQYAGTGPASEPETKAIVDLVDQIRPSLTVWYHQDLNRIDVGSGRAGQIQRRYAELTGLPVEPVTGGTYPGTATRWRRPRSQGVAFIVELGPTLDGAGAATHADAVLTWPRPADHPSKSGVSRRVNCSHPT